MDAKPVKPGASLSFVETPYRRQTLSYVLAFSPRLCDVLLDVEGEASVPRVLALRIRSFLILLSMCVRYVFEYRYHSRNAILSYVYITQSAVCKNT